MKDEKILDEEILSDEELEHVSGGGPNQTAGDSDFLNKLGYTHDTYQFDIDDYEGRINTSDIEKAWASAGVTCKAARTVFYDNEYWIGGQKVSRKDAFRHVMRKRGWNQIAIDCFDFDRYEGDF